MDALCRLRAHAVFAFFAKLLQGISRSASTIGCAGRPIFLYDQYSIMLGASHNLTLTSKLKFELMRTKVGLTSALVDGDIHNKSFNVFSMSYNFAF